MKSFSWGNEKNEKLKKERGVSFEKVLFCIKNNQLLDVIEHPNQKMYKGQRMYVVAIDNYAYIVPFVDDGDERFLKTIFPSRKYTKIYLRVRQKISSQFQVLRRSADKARKSMNIKHIQNFRNAVRRDASAPEM